MEGATSGLALASRPTEDLDAAVSVDDLGGGSLGLVGDFNLGKTNLDMVGVSRWVGQCVNLASCRRGMVDLARSFCREIEGDKVRGLDCDGTVVCRVERGCGSPNHRPSFPILVVSMVEGFHPRDAVGLHPFGRGVDARRVSFCCRLVDAFSVSADGSNGMARGSLGVWGVGDGLCVGARREGSARGPGRDRTSARGGSWCRDSIRPVDGCACVGMDGGSHVGGAVGHRCFGASLERWSRGDSRGPHGRQSASNFLNVNAQ